MAVTLKTSYREPQFYIPEFGGNRYQAELDNPYWWVKILPATKAEVAAILRKPQGKRFVEADEDEVAETILTNRVPEIHGLILDHNGTHVEPKTGAELWEVLRASSVELNGITAELFEAVSMVSTLEKGIMGNLRSRSGISAPTTDRDIGPAKPAPLTGRTTPATGSHQHNDEG